jgi:hypothetical protein
MDTLQSRTAAFLKRLDDIRPWLDDIPLFIEHGGGGEPVAYTWTELVELVLRRFLEGGSWDDLELKNNFALFLNWLMFEICLCHTLKPSLLKRGC